MTSKVMSSLLTTFVMIVALPSLREDSQNELHAIVHVEPVENSPEIRPDGGNAETEIRRYLLVAPATEKSLDNPRLLRRKSERLYDSRPSNRIERERHRGTACFPSL